MNQLLPRPVARADYRARFTTAEFLAMAATGAFADMKLELVRGELQRMNPPMSSHGHAQSELAFRLRQTTAAAPGLFAFAEVGIALGPDTVRACDAALATVRPTESRLLIPTELLLVVEIADSTLSRDLGDKAADYADAGITTCWVVDVTGEVTHVLTEPGPEGYASRRVVRFSEPLAVPGTAATITLA